MIDPTCPDPDAKLAAPPPPVPGWVNWLVNYRFWTLGFILLVSIPCAFLSNRLAFDQSIESLYAHNNPQLMNFLQSRKWYGGEELIMCVWTQPDLLDEDGNVTDEGLEEVHQFEDKFRALPGIDVQSVQSIAGMLAPNDSRLVLRAILRLKSTREKLVNFSEGFLIGQDHKTIAIVMRLIPKKESPISRVELFKQARAIAEAHKYPSYIVGEPVQVHEMFRYVQQDGAILGWSTLVIIVCVLFVLFRSIRWVLLPVIVVQIAIYWTRSLLYLLGIHLSMVSSILNSLLIIIGVATITHIIVQYREYRRRYDGPDALKYTIAELSAPIFWTMATTIAGFASLLTSSISPVRSFGGMVAIGTFLVIVATLFVLPGFVLWGSSPAPESSFGEKTLARNLQRLAIGVSRYPRFITIFLLTVMFICGWGMTKLEVETDFSRNFRANSPIVKSLDFVEKNLGGAGTWELNFEAPENLTQDYVDQLHAATAELRELKMPGTDIPAFTKVIAISDGIDFMPNFIARTPEAKLDVLRRFQKEFESSLYARKFQRMRIILRGYERLPAELKLSTIAVARKIMEKHQFQDVKATGLYVLLAHLIESLIDDQLISFMVSGIGIAVMVWIAFGSVILGVISIIPNIFPLLILLGTLGWLGIPTNIGTAMIASVSLGLTVDSSIHYLSSYLKIRKQGGSHCQAIQDTHGRVGIVLMFANLALVLGFLVLVLSNFMPLVYFGVLVSLAMLGGLIGNLILLPAVLSLIPISWMGIHEPPHENSTAPITV